MTPTTVLAKLANMETTVLQAKNQLSKLLRCAERGEEVIIRRGRGGKAFQLKAVEVNQRRTLKPDPRWGPKIKFRDADIWASKWKSKKRLIQL